jgi:hypothetical protein
LKQLAIHKNQVVNFSFLGEKIYGYRQSEEKNSWCSY